VFDPKIWATWLVTVALLGSWPPRLNGQGVSDSGVYARTRAFVLTNAPELHARRSATDAARARVRAAGSATPATIDLEVEEIPNTAVGDAQSIKAFLTWDLYTGGRRGLRRAVADRDVQEAVVRLRLAERRAAARTDQLLIRLAASMGIGRRLAAEDSLLAAAEEALQDRFAVGNARYVEVLRLRTERLRVQSDLATAMSDMSSQRRAMLALVAAQQAPTLEGLLDSTLVIELTDPFRRPLQAAPDLDSLVSVSEAVLLADVAAERATAARRLAGGERRISVSSFLGVHRFAVDSGGFSTGPTLGLSVALPFTTTGAAVEAATRDVDVSHAMRVAEARRTRAELGAARDRYEAARRRLAVFASALLRGASEERDAALAAYRGGEITLLELIDFERALSRAEITRLQTLIEAADAYAELQGVAP
jgi:cobalt-zinc-cadmium efflux system outer membrane protein